MGDQPNEVYDRLLNAEGELREQLTNITDERDRLRSVVDHLRESAESAIGQDRDDEYDEGNRDAWVYVRNVLDGRAGPASTLDVSGEGTNG